jgi:hypothetical protein
MALLAGSAAAPAQQPAGPPFKAAVQEDKAVVVEPLTPIDPVKHIQYQANGMGVAVRGEQNQTLHLSHFPSFKIDNQLFMQGQGGRFDFMNRPLPRGKGRQAREGFQSAADFGDLRVTVTVTLVPTRPANKAARRRLDAVTIHYLVENKGQQAHQFGLRIYMDVFIVNNDGALFAAPTIPGKILNGMVLRGKQFPPYLQLLQVPNLQNPGFVAHLTFDLGSRLEKIDRVVLSRFADGLNGWEMQPLQSVGDSALGIFWEPRPIKPGGKREFAYGYGQGITPPLEGEGRVQVALGGSFAPGKLFNVTAYVTDPVPGQALTLELPPGTALAEGKATQPVPEPLAEQTTSLVLWRARVLRPGRFPVRVHSSTGVTQGKTVTVSPAGG